MSEPGASNFLNKTPTPRRNTRPRQVGDILADLAGDLLALERAVAGYNSLSLAWQTLTGSAPESGAKGLPIFAHKASADGVKVMECCVDLKHMHPHYVQYVLPAFIHTHGNAMKMAIDDMVRHAGEMSRIVERAISSQQPPEAESSGQPSDDDEVDENVSQEAARGAAPP